MEIVPGLRRCTDLRNKDLGGYTVLHTSINFGTEITFSWWNNSTHPAPKSFSEHYLMVDKSTNTGIY